MLTRKFVTAYGFVGIGIMALLLIVIWFKMVPESYYVPLFAIALVLWASRIILRMMLLRKERREASVDTHASNPSS